MLLLVGLAGIILWVYVVYIVGPIRREGVKLAQQLGDARRQLIALQRATTNEATLREQYRQLDQTVQALLKSLPHETELSSVIERLSDLASQTDVKIQTIFPQRTPELSPGQKKPKSVSPPATVFYKDVLIQIDATAGYHQLGSFLGFVESGDKPIRLVNLRITADPAEPKRHRIKMLVRSYFAVNATTRSALPTRRDDATHPS